MATSEWKEVSAGHYSRPMDEIEDAYATIASGGRPLDREHWAITATLKLHFGSPDFVMAVKNAWIALRLTQPALASTNEGTNKVYQILSESEKLAWLNETFKVMDSEINAIQLFAQLRPVARATLYILPKTKELVIRTSHDRIDGIGIVMLLDNLVYHIAFPTTLQLDEEAKKLSPPFKIAASIPDATPAQLMKLGSTMESWLSNLPSIGLAAQTTEQLPSATKIAQIAFSPSQTSQVISQVKAKGFTVTHAVHAAIILATKLHAQIPNADTRKYATFSVFNLRDQCMLPFNSSTHAFSIYHSGWPIIIIPGTFDNTASQLKEFYEARREDPDFLPMVAPLFSMLKGVASTSKPSTPSSEPILSSLGVLEKRLKRQQGSVKVEEFGLALDTLTPQVYVVLWTWKDCLTIRACYNESYHVAESAERFLSLVKQELLMNLSIS